MVRALPRRALLAATTGALYGLLILPAPETFLGVTLYGVVWFVMGASLLFLHALAYHAYVFWAILWLVWRAITVVRDGLPGALDLVLDFGMPLVSLAFLLTSGYLGAAQARRDA